MCTGHAAYFLMDRLILNCDLGEDEPIERTDELLSLVDAANISCGYHAGNFEKTATALKLAQKYGVKIGAHPGIPIDGGRGSGDIDPTEFRNLLDMQLGTFQETARSLGIAVTHVKLHGILYHAVERNLDLAETYLDFLGQAPQSLAVFSLAGGSLVAAAKARGLEVYQEAFADRDYQSNGSLVPRSEPGALLTAAEAIRRIAIWQDSGKLPIGSAQRIDLSANTLCVHADSTEALVLLQQLRLLFKK